MSATRLLRDLKACLLQKDFQDDFNPLVVKYMHLKEKKERLRLLENFFTLDCESSLLQLYHFTAEQWLH